jgi:hypothetical protein
MFKFETIAGISLTNLLQRLVTPSPPKYLGIPVMWVDIKLKSVFIGVNRAAAPSNNVHIIPNQENVKNTIRAFTLVLRGKALLKRILILYCLLSTSC